MREAGSERDRSGAWVRRWVPWAVGLTLLLIAAVLGGLFYLMAPTNWETWETPPASGQGLGALLARNVSLEHAPARPYLGITYQEVNTQAADHAAMPTSAGALVTSVGSGSPAAMAGLNTGDVVLAVDGQSLSRESPLLKLLLMRRSGDRVKLMVQRGQDHLNLEVTLGKK